MTIEAVERFVVPRPFKPFTVRESSGVTHRIASPESIRVLPKLGVVMVFPPDGSLVMLGTDQLSAAFYEARAEGKRKPK